MAVRVGVTIKPQHASYAQMRDAWLRVEEMGADTLFNWDHFFPLTGDPDGKHFECWTMLGAKRGLRISHPLGCPGSLPGAYRPVEVSDEVLLVLDADGEAHEAVGYASSFALLAWDGGVGHGRGVCDQGLYAS